MVVEGDVEVVVGVVEDVEVVVEDVVEDSNGKGGDEAEPWIPVDDLQADIPPTAIPFREEPALRISLSADSSPLDFFSLFFDDVIIHMLVDGTNDYAGDVIAEKERAGKSTPKSRWVKWRPVTTQEMKAVLALIINMGVIHCPERASYWRTSWESYIPFFYNVLPRNRFEEIFWLLHL